MCFRPHDDGAQGIRGLQSQGREGKQAVRDRIVHEDAPRRQAKGVHVRLAQALDGQVMIVLGSPPEEGPARQVVFVARGVRVNQREAKVREARGIRALPVAADEDVLRLDVAVDDVALVQCLDAASDVEE